MSSRIVNPPMRSAAWRISLWATLAFACGTMLVFVVLHTFVADDIQRRTDAWLSGEVQTMADVAEHTPKDRLYRRAVGEIAELASREVPNKLRGSATPNDSVFFLQTGTDGSVQLWVGAGDGIPNLNAIHENNLDPDTPSHLRVEGFRDPFRVASAQLKDGSHVYLGVSERDELRVLGNLRLRFLLLGLVIVLFGFLIVFFTTSRMLGYVREITEAASRIGETDLSSRVPTIRRNDEVGHLALTLNGMLDRIESSMHQLHTITDALAHDLRSPLTAIRGKLEVFLSHGAPHEGTEPIVSAVEELDRLTDFLNTSLDVAEAKADALRLTRSDVDLDELLRAMIDLYEPSMAERNLHLQLRSAGPLHVFVDAALLHRMVANLLDNELKHLPVGHSVTVFLAEEEDAGVLVVEDDGPGFSPDIASRTFERGVKGKNSSGYGLGLAFVEAVARAHGGMVRASNREQGGARLEVRLPLTSVTPVDTGAAMALAGEPRMEAA